MGDRFLKEWPVRDKIIGVNIFFKSHSTFLWMTQTQEMITHRVSNIYEWIWAMCMSGGRFHKEWQVTDKIIEWIFFQFTFKLLWMTQTQEIITHRILKIYTWIWGMCMSGEGFLKNDKRQINLLSEDFFKSHSTFYEWLKLKK